MIDDSNCILLWGYCKKKFVFWRQCINCTPYYILFSVSMIDIDIDLYLTVSKYNNNCTAYILGQFTNCAPYFYDQNTFCNCFLVLF